MSILSKIKSLISKKEDYSFLTQVSEYDLVTDGKPSISQEVINNDILLFIHDNAPFIFKNNRYYEDWKTQYIRKTHNYFYTSLKENPEQYYLDFVIFIKQLNLFLSNKKISMEKWYHTFHHLISNDELTNFKVLFYYHYFQSKKNKISKMLISKENLNIIFLLACALKAHNIVDFLINTEFDEFKSDIIFNILKDVKKGQYQEKDLLNSLNNNIPYENIDINIKEGDALYVAITNKNNELVKILAKRSDLIINFNNYEIFDKIIRSGNFNILKLLHEKYIHPQNIPPSYIEAIKKYVSPMLRYKESENTEMIFTYLADKNLIDFNAFDHLNQAIQYEFPIILGILLKNNIFIQKTEELNPLLNGSNSKTALLNNIIGRKALFIKELLEQKFLLNYIIEDYKTEYLMKQKIYMGLKKEDELNPHFLTIIMDNILIHYRSKKIDKSILSEYINAIHENDLLTYFNEGVIKIENFLLNESNFQEHEDKKETINKI
jgi:hypothetical protein